MGSRIHANRIARTGLDTKTTVDAAQGIDFVSYGEFLSGVVVILARLDVNALSRTGSRAQKTSRALNCPVIFQGQAVSPPEGIGIRRSFIGILDGNCRLKFAG